ncbi:MAG: hypothetical protein WAM71_03375 [Candidatus Korobacteraceae bacterium]
MDQDELQAGYEEMARDVENEADALAWCEALITDMPFDGPENEG